MESTDKVRTEINTILKARIKEEYERAAGDTEKRCFLMVSYAGQSILSLMFNGTTQLDTICEHAERHVHESIHRMGFDPAKVLSDLREYPASIYTGVNAPEGWPGTEQYSALDKVLLEINVECWRQSKKWSAEHDKTHTPAEWQSLLQLYLAKYGFARREGSPDARRRLIQIAALAASALVALDATTPPTE